MDLGKEQAECAKMWMERRTINKTQACETLVDGKVVAKEKTHVTVLLHTSVVFPLFTYVFPSCPRSGQAQPEKRQGEFRLVRSPVCANWQKEKKNLADSLGTPSDLWYG